MLNTGGNRALSNANFHLHYGKGSSLMFNRIQVDVEPGVVFISIERPALGINIVYEGVGIETVMLDVGNVMIEPKRKPLLNWSMS